MPDNTPLTKADLDAGLENLKNDLKEYIDERTHDAETHLRGFADYNNRLIALEGKRGSQH